MIESHRSRYKWYILALGTSTHIFAVGMPRMCMPVLFSEISEELGLSLVQVGIVWGILSLSGLLTGLIGGILGDRYGTKLTLAVACLMGGVFGGLRGLSNSFLILIATMFLFGFATSTSSLNTHKAAGVWFPKHQLGIANGILSTGMGIGVTLGSLVSATVLSPLLGSWRNVLFLYGAISIVIGLLWSLSKSEPGFPGSGSTTSRAPLRQSLSQVARIKEVWILAISEIFFSGCLQGMTGYLPLFLRGKGWTAAAADGALAAHSAAGMVGAIPISLLSDRIGSRKAVLIVAQLVTLIGVGLLVVVDGSMLWLVVISMGFFREALAAVMITLTMELEGVGEKYAGTALGLRASVSRIGGLFSPPLGNSFASIGAGLPFAFWSGLAAVSVAMISLIKERTGWKKPALMNITG